MLYVEWRTRGHVQGGQSSAEDSCIADGSSSISSMMLMIYFSCFQICLFIFALVTVLVVRPIGPHIPQTVPITYLIHLKGHHKIHLKVHLK